MARHSYRVRFTGGSGYELAGIVDRPDHMESFPVAIFAHCFTCNKDLKAIARISRGLAELGIAVMRFDMTGLGGSQGQFSETNFTTNLADLESAISFADRELGSVTALLGHSFGGAVSLAFAGTSDRIRAVATIAAPSDTRHLAELLIKMNPQIQVTGRGQVTIGGLSWTITTQMLEDFRQHDLPARIATIGCPTLLFHSPVDQTLGYDHALRIMGLIQASPHQNSPASFVSLPGADHLLVNDSADVELVTQTTAAFLNRYAQPT